MEEIMTSIISLMTKDITERREKLLKEACLRCVPPIKGEITRGKIRYRGIRQCFQQGTMRWWIEQRGKRISPVLNGAKIILSSYRGLCTAQTEKEINEQIRELRNEWERK